MRAPVYRNIEESTTFLGLTFPLEVVLAFALSFACLATLPAGKALVGVAVSYGAIRALSHGRPPGFAQHWLNWRLRRALGGGRLSAAARTRTPRLPFATYAVARAPKPPVQCSASRVQRAMGRHSDALDAGRLTLDGPSRPGANA